MPKRMLKAQIMKADKTSLFHLVSRSSGLRISQVYDTLYARRTPSRVTADGQASSMLLEHWTRQEVPGQRQRCPVQNVFRAQTWAAMGLHGQAFWHEWNYFRKAYLRITQCHFGAYIRSMCRRREEKWKMFECIRDRKMFHNFYFAPYATDRTFQQGCRQNCSVAEEKSIFREAGDRWVQNSSANNAIENCYWLHGELSRLVC